MTASPATDCYTCAREAEVDRLPPCELIGLDEYWRVAHATWTALAGWLVLVPRRHVTSLADLTQDEAAALGTWQVRLSRALHRTTGCLKTYVMQYAEAPGYEHVHFHVVPRATDLPPDLRGPAVFGLLGRGPEDDGLTDAAMDEVARRLQAALLDG